MSKYVFPALFESQEGFAGFTVTFPDIKGCITEGDSLEDALKMAKEALALHLYGMEEEGDNLPNPSNPAKLPKVDEGFYTLIEVRTNYIREKKLNKSITKNVTMPKWLEIEATKENLNFSQILQNALKKQLGYIQ